MSIWRTMKLYVWRSLGSGRRMQSMRQLCDARWNSELHEISTFCLLTPNLGPRPREPRASGLEPRTSDLEPGTSSLEPRASNLEPRTSDIGHRTSNLGPRASDLGSGTSDLGPRTSSLGPRTSDLGPRTSSLGPRTSDLEPRTSRLGPRTSSLGPRALEPRASNLEPRTSDLEPRTSNLGPRSSNLGPRASNLGPRTSDLEPRTSNLGPRPRTSDLGLGSLPSAFWNIQFLKGFSRPNSQSSSSTQWEFQGPKMEVLYHIRQYFGAISPYIGLIYVRYLHFMFLRWPLKYRSLQWDRKKSQRGWGKFSRTGNSAATSYENMRGHIYSQFRCLCMCIYIYVCVIVYREFSHSIYSLINYCFI